MSRRFEFIDITRIVFALQGVLYHALLPYRTNGSWLINSPDSVAGVASVTRWMHSFRMNGFFLISGIVCWQLFQRLGTRSYVQTRFTRLALPFFTVLLTVNVAEHGLVARTGVGPEALATGLRVGHLWFMAYLLLFALSLPLLAGRADTSRAVRALSASSPARFERTLPLLLGAAALVLAVVAQLSTSWWYSKHYGFFMPSSLVLSASYFGVGAYIAAAARVDMFTTRPSIGWWIGATVGWVAIDAFVRLLPVGQFSSRMVLEHAYAIFALRIVFWLAHSAAALVSRPAVDHAARSTLTMYLLHHVIVVGGALFFVSVAWPPLIEIALLAFIGMAVPHVLHERVVRKVPWIALLLNGAQRSSASADRSVAAPAAPARG